jgi:tetratricopeptide (TPR) repeat protein
MDLVTTLSQQRRKTLAIGGGWIVLLLTCIWSYWPGLGGPFVFDDFGSLSALGDRGGVRDWDSFRVFVFGGHAGPTGRPLALLSFLIDAQNWPADPWPFKRTNLVIHLLNGVLLGVLTQRILNVLNFDKQAARWLALISASCWLLHPFLVSTTLYAVQRMAQLSTLFSFAGLIVYLHYRATIAAVTLKAYVGMSLAIGVFTLLAMICKENGILLPLMVGVVEITIVASQRDRIAALHRAWSVIFLLAPAVIIALYLGRLVLRESFFDVIAPRDFSIYERALTQPRVLIDYLRHWFLPGLYTSGVFQDHFLKSTGLLAPVTTLLSVLWHAAIISLALVKRYKWPLFAIAVLFFYVGHLLESTVVNLEMYFEHRNYLAAAFLSLPVAALLQRRVNGAWFGVATLATLLVLASFTRYSATIWKAYPDMVAVAARIAPTSVRAQTQYATNLFNEKRYDESLQVIDRAIENNPARSSLLITASTIRCRIGVLSRKEFRETVNVLSVEAYDARSIRLYTALVNSIVDRHCPDVDIELLRTLFTDMLQVPQNAKSTSLRYSQVNYFLGLVEVHAGQPDRAMEAFEASLRARSGASHAMMMAALMATNDYYREALLLSGLALAKLEKTPSSELRGDSVSIDDVKIFRAEIQELLSEQAIGRRQSTHNIFDAIAVPGKTCRPDSGHFGSHRLRSPDALPGWLVPQECA